MEANTGSTLADIFSSEVLRWRYFKALSVSFMLQLLISNLVCNSINTLIYEVTWNPLKWVYYIFSGIFRPYWLFKVLLPAGCYILLARIHIHSYAVSWWVPERRLQYLSRYFHPKRLLCSVTLSLVSICLLQYSVALVQSEFTSLTVPCSHSDDKMCINHQALLILFFGLIFGFRLSFKYFLHNHQTISFPLAQPNFLIRLKSKLKARAVIESCALFDVGPGFILSVYFVYLLLGGMVCQWVSPLLGVTKIQESFTLWPILLILLDLRFLLTLVLCLVLLAYNLHTFFVIFEESVVQPIEFPLSDDDVPHITPDSQLMAAWTLNNGLGSSNQLLQLLAFHHLRDIALDQTVWGHSYRAKVFSISQPGGHPRNWQSIVTSSLHVIQTFCNRLKEQNCLEEKAPLQQSILTSLHHTDLNKNELVKEPSTCRRKWEQTKESLKQFPLISYLLSELPNSKNRQIFAESQSVIWAVEGLANLVATSYSDDKYGVVQRNVADILSSLIQLQMVVEKVGRNLPFRKGTKGTNFGAKIQNFPHDLPLRKSLKLTLRSSLYIVTNTFKESIRNIHVADDVRTKLESYLAFQEG